MLKNDDQTLLSHSVDGYQKFPARKPVEVKVVYPMISRVLHIPGGCFRFLNHQQFQISPHCNPPVIKRLSLHKLSPPARLMQLLKRQHYRCFRNLEEDAASPRIVGFFLDKKSLKLKANAPENGSFKSTKREISSSSNPQITTEIFVGVTTLE